jgi:hypothetical protein
MLPLLTAGAGFFKIYRSPSAGCESHQVNHQETVPSYPVIPAYEGRSAGFRYLFNKKREENKRLNKIFPPRPRK